MYPSIGANCSLHLSPDGGTLFEPDGLIELSRNASEFLASCDGRTSLDQLLAKVDCDKQDRSSLVLEIAALVESRRLLMAGATSSEEGGRVTGSREAWYPPHVVLELTEQCNLACRHCYRDSDSSKRGHMPTERLLALIDELVVCGLRSIEITGGEPLMHPDFDAILAHLCSRLKMVGLLTNGVLLKQKHVDMLVNAECAVLVSISLDGSTAERHDLRRGKAGAFLQTVAAIQKLTGAGVDVRVTMCVDNESFEDIEPTLLLARQLGARVFSYTPVLPLGRGADWALEGWRLDGLEVRKAEAAIAERYKGFLGVLAPEVTCTLEDKGCGAGYRTFAIDPYGNVRPCATFPTESIRFGNLIRQPLKDVFGGELVQAMARLPSPGPRTCGDCRNAQYCSGCAQRGLMGMKMVETCAWASLPGVDTVIAASRSGAAQAGRVTH